MKYFLALLAFSIFADSSALADIPDCKEPKYKIVFDITKTTKEQAQAVKNQIRQSAYLKLRYEFMVPSSNEIVLTLGPKTRQVSLNGIANTNPEIPGPEIPCDDKMPITLESKIASKEEVESDLKRLEDEKGNNITKIDGIRVYCLGTVSAQ
jgi:hypothetical protein